MKINKLAAVLCAAVLTLTGISLNAGENISGDDTEVKILCIGDSITDGYGTEGSYRKFLYKGLTDKGYSIDMTGPNCSWGDAQYADPSTGETFTYDPAHCGYSGYAIVEYPGRNGILETIKSGDYIITCEPDIVILQIGTNDLIDNHDIDNAGERLDTLVTYILDNISDDSALFVTTVPFLDANREDVYQWFSNYRHSDDWQTRYDDETAQANLNAMTVNYNSQVLKVVTEKNRQGADNLYFGDICSVLDDISVQLKDGVHPNDTGYKLMGEYWTDMLLDYLSGNDSPAVTEPSSSPVTPPSEVTAAPSDEPSAPPVTEPSSLPSAEPSAVPESLSGDINGDSQINSQDMIILMGYLLGTEENINLNRSDMNGNGRTDIGDFVILKDKLIQSSVLL